ncbi:hypothetical protein B0H11DRAFT_2249452 [Mycena galericulata]|nr:hypothetical protein B0H11DRAFT_2249452 [Mycena galericulata]
MADICTNVEALLALQATLTAQLENAEDPPSTPEVAALKRLKDAGIKVGPPKKPRKGDNSKPTEKKQASKAPIQPKSTEIELDNIADERIAALLPEILPPPLTAQELVNLLLHPPALSTAEEEDAFVVQMMRGFASPDGSWTDLLTAAGLHSNQTVSIHTATAAAAAQVPGQPLSLVTTESNLLSFIKSARADTYATGRILLCEIMCSQPAWNQLSNIERGVHNREVFMAQNPTFFDADKTKAEKHTMLTRNGDHYKAMTAFLKNDREPLTRARNQVFNFGQVFGFGAIIHPAASLESLGRRTPTLSRVSGRLHLALAKRPELRSEIEARGPANLNVVREFVRGLVVPENKDPVREYFTDFHLRLPVYKY